MLIAQSVSSRQPQLVFVEALVAPGCDSDNMQNKANVMRRIAMRRQKHRGIALRATGLRTWFHSKCLISANLSCYVFCFGMNVFKIIKRCEAIKINGLWVGRGGNFVIASG